MSQGYEKFFSQARKVKNPGAAPAKGATPKTKFSVADKIDQHFSQEDGKRHNLTPEQKLKIKFLERKRQLRKKNFKKSGPPIFAGFCLVAIISSMALGFHYSDKVDHFLRRFDIRLNTASAEEGTVVPNPLSETKKAEKSADSGSKIEEKKSQTEGAQAKDDTPDFRNMSKEDLSYFSHLVDRKKQLDQREAELNKLDEELQKQRVELDQKIQRLEKMRAEISGVLKQRVTTDQEKVDKLVQFYSTMKPQQAAKVIESLNEDLAVEVLDKMKKKSAAEIMNSLDSKKAKRLSEMLAGYRKPANDEESKK